MIIKLKENKPKLMDKLFNKTAYLKKERGENILFAGCSHSGKKESMMSLYSLLFSEGYIGEKSIIADFYGDNSIYCQWISILTDAKKSEITKKDFTLFNIMNNKEYENFKKIDFKSTAVQSILNQHTLFIFPALEKCTVPLVADCNKQFYDFLNNLPINTGMEIPILISDIYLLGKNDYRRYSKAVKNANKKGYFFIVTIEGYPENDIEQSLPILKDIFKHMFIMTTQIDDKKLNDMFSKMNLKKNIKSLNAGQYYYLKDFNAINKSPKSFPYLPPSMLSNLPDYERMDKLILINKINNF
jgi:hypothetical protein